MSLLQDLLEKMKDEKLSQFQLEQMRDQLIHIKSTIHIQIAELKKKRALFMIRCEAETNAKAKVLWEASLEGQKLLELEGYIRGIGGEIDSLRDRVWSFLRQS